MLNDSLKGTQLVADEAWFLIEVSPTFRVSHYTLVNKELISLAKQSLPREYRCGSRCPCSCPQARLQSRVSSRAGGQVWVFNSEVRIIESCVPRGAVNQVLDSFLCPHPFVAWISQEHGSGAADANQAEGHESSFIARLASQKQTRNSTQVSVTL